MAADFTILSVKGDTGQGSSCVVSVTVRESVFGGDSLETFAANVSDFKSAFMVNVSKVKISKICSRPI